MRPAQPSRSFYCLRHGATDWNRQGRFQGLTDNPLNDDGLAQAHEAAGRLKHARFARIVSSPLRRAARTAEIIGAAASLPVTIDARIIECDFGSLEGLSVRTTMQAHGVTTAEGLISLLPSDGEVWTKVAERSLDCVSEWLDREPGGDILFVCHDAVMQAMAQALRGSFFQNRHATPFRYARTREGWTLEEVGQDVSS